MKLKYYMRGLGVGIIVTALLMGVALSGRKETMTDEEIRERALEMGMVEEENGVLADDLGKEETETPELTAQTISENEAEQENDSEAESAPEQESALEAEGDPEQEIVPEAEGDPEGADETETDSIIITVYSGDGSRSVANRLQEAGVIDDAAAFDVFLCGNGYDKRIAAGEHEIPANATPQEIAEALTR